MRHLFLVGLNPLLGLGCVVVLCASLAAQETTPPIYASYSAAAEQKWAADIAALEQLDQTVTVSEDNILFIGSSSIRLWKTIAEDMHPYSPIRRGYGGAKFSDLAVFAKRLIEPHRYRAMVIFVANDVAGNDDDKTPAQVAELLRYIVGVSRAHQPDASVLVIEVTPTERRWSVWPRIRQVNAAMRDVCLTEPKTYFLPTAEYFLTEDNQPIQVFFRDDKLHLTAAGYQLWARLIKERLDEVFAGTLGAKIEPTAATDRAP